MAEMHRPRLVDEIEQGRLQKLDDFFRAPIVAERRAWLLRRESRLDFLVSIGKGLKFSHGAIFVKLG